MRLLSFGILIMAGLPAITCATASTRPVHHDRPRHSRGGASGTPITEGSSLVRINAVGEVIEPRVGSAMPSRKKAR